MKLLRVMSVIKATKNNVLTLEDDNTNTLIRYIDVALAVQVGMNSHIGSIFTMGK